jgi:hypothetical protein
MRVLQHVDSQNLLSMCKALQAISHAKQILLHLDPYQNLSTPADTLKYNLHNLLSYLHVEEDVLYCA